MKTLFVSLGCDKNTVDTRKMAGILEDGGICSFTEDEAAAEAAVVNTCAFIDSAKQESIDEILSVAQLKKTGRLKYLIVTGCLAQRFALCGKPIVKVGVNFDSTQGNIEDWIIEEE